MLATTCNVPLLSTTMPTTSTHLPADPAEVLNARLNIKLLKTLRGIADQQLADGAGFGSRQMVADRLSGRTPINLGELCSFGATLRVTVAALIAPSDQCLAWVAQNPDYQPPITVEDKPRTKTRKTSRS